MLEEEQESAKDVSGRGHRGLVLSVAVVVLAAVGIWFWISRASDSSAETNGSTTVRSTLHLETFVLNLADADQRSYLRIGIDLGLSQDAKKLEHDAPVAEVRDTILGVLSQAKVDDLLTSAGKTKLKQDLLHAVQERIPSLGVQEILFTEFLIQR